MVIKQRVVGDAFILKRGMLGNPSGAIGYVFNIYPAFDNQPGNGVQIIFPNGQYDGFSPDEQRSYLFFVGHFPKYVGYEFRGIMWVSQAFRGGYWSFE